MLPSTRYRAPVERQTYTVRGNKATSYEYNFAFALEHYELEYLFQVDYWGGRKLRGGIVLDFLVFSIPLPTPVFINGEYWHSGKRRGIDEIQMIYLQDIYHGQVREPKEYWGQDVSTIDLAKGTVRRDFSV